MNKTIDLRDLANEVEPLVSLVVDGVTYNIMPLDNMTELTTLRMMQANADLEEVSAEVKALTESIDAQLQEGGSNAAALYARRNEVQSRVTPHIRAMIEAMAGMSRGLLANYPQRVVMQLWVEITAAAFPASSEGKEEALVSAEPSTQS